MVFIKTPICEFGSKIIDFKLKNIHESIISLDNIKGERGTLIMFICNHCPYVKAIIKQLVLIVKDLKKEGINSVAIMPNDYIKYPEDNLEKMKQFSQEYDFCFEYLIDETQVIAKNYKAVCTPDFFGYNKKDELQYRGRFAEIKNLEIQNTDIDLLNSMIQISRTGNGPKSQFPSAGCSIKWK